MEKPILLNSSTSQPPFPITLNLTTFQIPSSALSVGSHSSHIKSSLILVSCQGHEPAEKQEKQGEKQQPTLLGFDKLGKILKENLRPKQKGDWKDLMLMSLSFAVYVYISQRIVCAYYAWISMALNHPW